MKVSNQAWKKRLADAIPEDLVEDINAFETEVELKKLDKLDERVFAESRWRRGVYGQSYDNGKRNDGAAILVISEELEELFEISDRIAVIANGKLSPSKKLADTSIDEIGVWMSGMWPGADRAETRPVEGQASA